MRLMRFRSWDVIRCRKRRNEQKSVMFYQGLSGIAVSAFCVCTHRTHLLSLHHWHMRQSLQGCFFGESASAIGE